MAHDVVRVRVAAVLVVRRHDVRAELADHADQRLGGHLDRLAARSSPRAAAAAGRPRAAPSRRTPASVCCTPRISCALAISRRRTSGRSRRISGSCFSARVEHVAALAARAGDHQHVDALGGVPRHRRRALAGLVVGVRVHRHQPQPFTHLHTCPRSRTGRHRQWSSTTDRRPSIMSPSCGRPDGRSPRAAPPPGSRHRQWWVVGRSSACLTRHWPSPSGGAWPARSGQVTWTDLGYAHVDRPQRRGRRTTCTARPTATCPAPCRPWTRTTARVGAVEVTIPPAAKRRCTAVTLVTATTNAVTGEVRPAASLPAGEPLSGRRPGRTVARRMARSAARLVDSSFPPWVWTARSPPIGVRARFFGTWPRPGGRRASPLTTRSLT